MCVCVCVCVCTCTYVDLCVSTHSFMSNSFVIPWTLAHQAPLSMGFLGREYRSEVPFPPPGDLPDPGIKPTSLALPGDSLPSDPPGKTCVKSKNVTVHCPQIKYKPLSLTFKGLCQPHFPLGI